MRRFSLLLTLFVATAALAPLDAAAQDDEFGDLDGDKPEKAPSKAKKKPEVREIVKGTYAKSNVGGSLYLGKFAGWVSPGSTLAMAVGRDFVNKERMSMAWEIALTQSVHNGKQYQLQIDEGGACVDAGGAAPCIQGDLRTYGVNAMVEWSTYPNRRFGLGFRAGGGVLFSPLLMNDEYYNTEVVQDAWGGVAPAYHTSPHPVGIGGPTFEYYTKLSHFSVGVDADVFYAVGFDLGANIAGTLKYTF
jgi:hypothetical protein